MITFFHKPVLYGLSGKQMESLFSYWSKNIAAIHGVHLLVPFMCAYIAIYVYECVYKSFFLQLFPRKSSLHECFRNMKWHKWKWWSMRALGYHKHVQLIGTPSNTGISFILLLGKGAVWSRVVKRSKFGSWLFKIIWGITFPERLC